MAAGEDMSGTLDRLGGSLINAVLGGLILWVGQTTVRHAGQFAGMNEKIAAVDQQFTEVEKRQESMRKWLENVVNDMKDGGRGQLTLKDGDELVARVHEAETAATDLERRFGERLAALDVKLTTLEVGHRGSQEVAALQYEVAQLRSELTRAASLQQYQEPLAGLWPHLLPPVDTRRRREPLPLGEGRVRVRSIRPYASPRFSSKEREGSFSVVIVTAIASPFAAISVAIPATIYDQAIPAGARSPSAPAGCLATPCQPTDRVPCKALRP